MDDQLVNAIIAFVSALIGWFAAKRKPKS